MIRRLIGLALFVGAILVGYNYYLGNAEEKANSEKIINQGKELVNSLGKLLKEEKQKLDEGKYDAVLDKMGEIYKEVRKQVGAIDSKLMNELEELESEKNKLERDRKNKQINQDELNEQIDELHKKTERLFNQIKEGK